MNRISQHLKEGTLGELLVVLRFLQYDIQAAPPLKDSGNDLIAVRGDDFRSVQVKTTTTDRFDCRGLPEKYHLLALVQLDKIDPFHLDNCKIFLLSKGDVKQGSYAATRLTEYDLNQGRIDTLFGECRSAACSG
ncbi:MAG: hypothetical protein Q7T26_06930 [Dehalococcoidia bacterium]|nr:hypothetical protein [Dehalococcoidia bacterium]